LWRSVGHDVGRAHRHIVLGAAVVKVMPELGGPTSSQMDAHGRRQIAGGGPQAWADARQLPKLAPPDPVQRTLVARCTEVLDLTADVKAFRFVDAAGHPMDYKPGQFVTLELEVEGKRVFRSYTMSSTPTQTAHFELTVKRVEGRRRVQLAV
jgi:hypothetical protein